MLGVKTLRTSVLVLFLLGFIIQFSIADTHPDIVEEKYFVYGTVDLINCEYSDLVAKSLGTVIGNGILAKQGASCNYAISIFEDSMNVEIYIDNYLCKIVFTNNTNTKKNIACESLPSQYYQPIGGCMDETSIYYNPLATVEDGSCGYVIGCTDVYALNYDITAKINSGCIYSSGCMDSKATNYNPIVKVDDGSCIYKVGCTNNKAINYDVLAKIDDGSCIFPLTGCTDLEALNYNPDAKDDDGSCLYLKTGCINPDAKNYDSDSQVDDGSCIYYNMGCINSNALNYNSSSEIDDGSCIFPIYGCTDELALNYNSKATNDDSSCTFKTGCTNSSATNYNPLAIIDDLSCSFYVEPETNIVTQQTPKEVTSSSSKSSSSSSSKKTTNTVTTGDVVATFVPEEDIKDEKVTEKQEIVEPKIETKKEIITQQETKFTISKTVFQLGLSGILTFVILLLVIFTIKKR
ncbi:hypothetical protein JXM83_02280 [Candidatus Woesearchaeota archaeon]|nr:hypothetical protein [Candidatus Woesearchaeota archaeon]